MNPSTVIALDGWGGTSTTVATLGWGGWWVSVEVPVTPEYLGGGGGVGGNWPVTGGRHTSTYKSKPVRPVPVTIRVTMQGKTTNRTFMVRPSKIKYIVKIANIVNSISTYLSVEVSNMKRTVTRVINIIFPDK